MSQPGSQALSTAIAQGTPDAMSMARADPGACWDVPYDGVSNIVGQYVGYLPRKIDHLPGVQYLR